MDINKKFKGTLLGGVFLGFIIGIYTTACFDKTKVSKAETTSNSSVKVKNAILDNKIDIAKALNDIFTSVAQEVIPSVVSIYTEKTINVPVMPFFEFPFDEFFGIPNPKNNKPRTRKYKQEGLGSGIIVSKDGYILTNYHVVKDADEIKVVVKICDKEKEFKGKVVGADPASDVAVVKIDPKNVKLKVAKLGDSDKLKVGEWVCAIGAPLGFPHTFTTGVVSALHRNLSMNLYENFIQTDAAINPGNSGGPLVNLKGEVIGINTAIVSKSGGYQGIGFAIPINMAKKVMHDLITKGKVSRGWLGIGMQPFTDELVKAFGLKEKQGVLVAKVFKNSPADKAGLKPGDIIIEFNGKKIADMSTLRNLVGNSSPGTEFTIKVLRNGKIIELKGKLGEREEKEKIATNGNNKQTYSNIIGVSVKNAKDNNGVVIVNVEPNSPADKAGLKPGDIILQINQEEIKGVDSFKKIIDKYKNRDAIALLISRNGETSFVVLKLKSK